MNDDELAKQLFDAKWEGYHKWDYMQIEIKRDWLRVARKARKIFENQNNRAVSAETSRELPA